MWKIRSVLPVVTGLLLVASMAVGSLAVGPVVDVLSIKGSINPVLVDYVSRGIDHAQEDGAEAVIIQMDTPGGLDTAMRDIVQEMVNSPVPMVVYVSPSGARAASAGVFITMASHIAVMAPNTAIGAAHPVSLGGGDTSDAMQEKVLNDAAAYIRSLAQAHGRNMEWAEKAVRESVSATDEEALQLKVIDMVAPDLNTLISQLDGRQVTMLDGKVITLHTRGASVNRDDMRLIEKFLYAIVDPNIAYILLSIGSLGIMVEIFSPGLIFPGVAGAISLLLAFYALGVLSVNYAGVLLILLAFGLFVAEAITASFGVLFAGGITSLIIGSLILFKGASAVFSIDPWLIVLIVLIFAAMFAFVIQRVIKASRRQAGTGKEELAGKTAIVRVPLDPEGTVFIKGELWSAKSESGRVERGEEVTITGVEGLRLTVTRKA